MIYSDRIKQSIILFYFRKIEKLREQREKKNKKISKGKKN